MEENKELTKPNPHFPVGKREIWLLIGIALICVLMADFMAYGGFNLGFALTSGAMSLLSFLYLRRSGCKAGAYATALLVLNLVICGSFLRSDDVFVKFVMVCFLLLGGNLGMVLTAGQSRRDAGGILSLLDTPMAVFSFGVGELGNSFGGLNDARKNAGTMGKKNMAVLAGLAVAIPVMAVLIPLLIKADAAFEGLVNLLPKTDISEPIAALLLGLPLACVVYTRNTALKHRPKMARDTWSPRKFSALTVNTVLICVCVLYGVYLVSQLAYFVGGFAGILPKDFTMAEYARRGFFEMTWLAGINLAIIVVSAALTEPKDGKLPAATRILCLFIGLVTLFFAATASAKMFLYIGSYGLTRLRLLVQVIITFIALTVVFVQVWLFRPKFAYMKAVMLTAMAIGACVAWADVDTVVAAYNVGAYQSGRLERVDMGHLQSLGSGAVPYLQELAQDPDPTVAKQAKSSLLRRAVNMEKADLRGWNMTEAKAHKILTPYREEAEAMRLEEEKQQQILHDFRNNPLTRLCIYKDAGLSCQKLIDMFPEMSKHGEPVTFAVKDQGIYHPNGKHFADCPFSQDILIAMDEIGISGIAATDHYVYFRCDWDQSTILVWTADPEAATAALEEDFGILSCYPFEDQWYIMKGSL